MKREWLIKLRKSKQMTQKHISSAAFIDRAYYAQIESGRRNPSINVAKSIAHLLGFDPMDFFPEDFNPSLKDYHSPKVTILNPTTTEAFSNRTGLVLYLFSNVDVYYQHANTFLLSGVKNGRQCFLFDYKENLRIYEQNFNKTFDKNNEESVTFISLEEFSEEDVFSRLNSLLTNDEKEINVWVKGNPNYYGSLLKNFLTNDSLFVVSYNSTMITASAHIDLMRKYPYLMTDREILDSRLYKTATILPSLYIQENL
ncbi:helix-turn-helix transcriptional regulator [Bacillus sp. FJAT-29814]|uniref:helix-turn-helix transcriptional regulator n=1 Tax=Bacillus sp. FJAT-29814 TaxID=1729688 RepID=UPI0009EB03B5|nr:helix-turn-helix transcriptional regulator [Bacillus sp. FJAT-29814]